MCLAECELKYWALEQIPEVMILGNVNMIPRWSSIRSCHSHFLLCSLARVLSCIFSAHLLASVTLYHCHAVLTNLPKELQGWANVLDYDRLWLLIQNTQ